MTSETRKLYKVHPEFRYITEMVDMRSRVLDLGCGRGRLMEALRSEREALVQGIELDHNAVSQCVAKGLFVYQGDLNEGLADYADSSMDYVILTSTIQVLERPDRTIKEAARVGKKCIIALPNFGYYGVRFDLMFGGKMPKTRSLPYEWYDSPNIHLTTIKDFREFCDKNNLKILKEQGLVIGKGKCREVRFLPNFFADYGIFLVEQA